MDHLKPVSATVTACKICGGEVPLFGVVDFNKTSVEIVGRHVPLSGVPICYRCCAGCGFVFTDAFDGWSVDEFKRNIYNGDYHLFDPDCEEKRSRGNAEAVARLWGQVTAETRVLDYGGGEGALCGALRADGFPVAETYDPMVPQYASRPDGTFNLVTCFETFEHLPDRRLVSPEHITQRQNW
jgi:2-polyprenyl-6-hydroxyphenyl methylase/3-demethylubiquinone-9 3-methyltransferase